MIATIIVLDPVHGENNYQFYMLIYKGLIELGGEWSERNRSWIANGVNKKNEVFDLAFNSRGYE